MVKKNGHTTAAGVLVIVGACICLFLGIIFMWIYIAGGYRVSHGSYGIHHPEDLLSGVFGVLGFAFGLTAGILALKRKIFPLVIIGIAFIMLGGIFSFLEPLVGEILGIPVLLFAILGVAFTMISKPNFAKEHKTILKAKRAGLGSASLSLGLVAIILSLSWGAFIPILIIGILAIIFGAVSYFGESKDHFGLAGFILGLISVIVTVVYWILVFSVLD